MCRTSDGFKIAEYDMKTRGPGEFFGTQQSGFFSLSFAGILDEKLIKKVLDDARTYYKIEAENETDRYYQFYRYL